MQFVKNTKVKYKLVGILNKSFQLCLRMVWNFSFINSIIGYLTCFRRCVKIRSLENSLKHFLHCLIANFYEHQFTTVSNLILKTFLFQKKRIIKLFSLIVLCQVLFVCEFLTKFDNVVKLIK